MLLAETGWPPDVLDNQPVQRIEMFLLYKQIRDVVIFGGDFKP
jgi:hypothetical protein